LLDVVKRMIGRGDDIVLGIAGKSDWGSGLLAQLKQQTQEAGLEGRIHFFGYLADVTPVLEHCDVHVCPSLFPDPLPNVVNEAKLHGKPSVVFPTGGIPELIVHEADGYICRESSAEALMEGIAYFLADAARREAAGAAARKSLDEKFGREKYQREWAEVFLKTRHGT
jgi:glycosyltransferase involved in cell wall biosynthesis